MSFREKEVAEIIVDEGIDAQSIAAARANPQLKILCIRCGTSVWATEFEGHLNAHLEAKKAAPSHWEAL